MVRGARCGVENCRSRKYEEGEDGYLYCENGHRKGELIAGDDDDAFETAVRTTTRRRDDTEEPEKVYKAFRGAKATDLFVKCMQLILRHQLAFMINKKGLPAELETVVQDLWMLRISQLGHKIATESQESVSSQLFSTQDSETEAEDDHLFLPSRRKKLQGHPTLIDCLALCYLGSMTLRLPVTPGDIYTWTTEGDMPYRNAIRFIPPAMRNRLLPTHQGALSPNSLLSLRRFYTSLANLEINFENKFKIMWPSLNTPVLLFRYIKDLALPLELYDATIALGEKLGFDFALHISPGQRLNIGDLPEAQLISCLILCVKLIYPFDETQRHPRMLTEPTATAINWAEWTRIMREAKVEARGGATRYTTEQLTQIEEKDVFNMSGEQLDQYLDFYAQNFLDEANLKRTGADDDFHSALYDMFPITKSNPEASADQQPAASGQDKHLQLVRDIQSTTMPVRPIADDEDDVSARVLRPGMNYKEYRGALPVHVQAFYEEAARVAGLTVEMLAQSVRYIERKIARDRGRKEKGLPGLTVGMERMEVTGDRLGEFEGGSEEREFVQMFDERDG